VKPVREVPQQAPASPSDAQLVQRVLGGEREAFSELVRRHQESLYRYALGMELPPDVAQDLAQDAFVRAYQRLGQCRDAARFRAWLLGIVRHLVLDYRRDLRQRTVGLEAVSEADVAQPPPPVELRRALTAALASLPLLLREAFLLRHQHGHSYDEIATITGSRVSAVKMRVHRAREHLQQVLAAARM
jgi:RNA polymerase sigma-70 factor (ECF subfamily)